MHLSLPLSALLVVLAAGVTAGANDSALEDMDLRSNVEAAIRGTPATAALHLKIEIRSGVAIVTGRVRNLGVADQVVEIASKVRGIVEVDRTALLPENTGLPDDGLAAEIERALSDTPRFASSAMTLEVHGGVATFAGKIASGSLRKELRNVVGAIEGVVDLVDALETPETPDEAIRRALDLTFAPRALPRFPGQVAVHVDGGVVTFEGRVPRLFDKRKADQLAFAVNGVRRVDNRLELSGSSAVKVVYP